MHPARIALIGALVAACNTAASPSPTRPASVPPTSTAAVSPTRGPVGLFGIVGDAPVVARSLFPDRGAVLPGAIALDGETYHAWVVAFAETPGIQDLHHLTSSDAVSWTLAGDPSLERLSEGFGNPGAVPDTVLPGDPWVMYFTATPESQSGAWDLWRATAPGPDGPWTKSAEPVLRRGPAGAWDSGALDFPTVLATEDGFTMLYSGTSPAHQESGSIGYATSPDGIAWIKHDDPATTDAELAESDPVAEPGLCGGFDDRAIHQPRVMVGSGNLVMAYAGYTGPVGPTSTARVGYADSLDGGLTWGCEWPGPALDPTGLPDGFVHTIAAFQHGERRALLVEWLSGGGTDVWLAEMGAGRS